jgi:exosortase A
MIWRDALIRLAVAVAALLLLFWRDAIDMAAIWWTSSTFAHCLLIAPLAGWLVWQRRSEVAKLVPVGWGWGLVPLGLGAASWLLGEAGSIALLRHAGLVLMLQSLVLSLLGPQVTRGLLFPLFYLVFLVPFGEEFVPPLQTLTAKLSMAFLGLAGIPAHIEGVFIQTPFGLFEVAEACSGVKFLVAMVAYGALVANVCFRSWWRRVAFLAVSVIIPIIANGIRAYGIIHISYLTSTEFAVGVDHVIWGWIFFALVMALVMAIGWRFFDRGLDDKWLGRWANAPAPAPAMPARARWPLAAIALGVAALPVGWQFVVARTGHVPMTSSVALPEVPGWNRVPVKQAYPWTPQFKGANHQLLGAYQNAAGQRVELALALFGWQEDGKEMIGFGQGAVPPESEWSWANDTDAPAGGKAQRIFAPNVGREVVTFYVAGGTATGSAAQVKLATLRSRLFARDQAAVAILVSAEIDERRPPRPVIDTFIVAIGPPESLAQRLVAQARGR